MSGSQNEGSAGPALAAHSKDASAPGVTAASASTGNQWHGSAYASRNPNREPTVPTITSDRMALAAQVWAMRDHYVEVRCGCGARRVVPLGQMAEHSKMGRLEADDKALDFRAEPSMHWGVRMLA